MAGLIRDSNALDQQQQQRAQQPAQFDWRNPGGQGQMPMGAAPGPAPGEPVTPPGQPVTMGTKPATAPPWLNSSPPPAPVNPSNGAEPRAIGSPASAFGIGTKPMPMAPGFVPTYGSEASPGVQIGQVATWEGGPALTQTRTDATGLPTLAGGMNTTGMPKLADGLDTSGFADFDDDFAGASQQGARDAYAGATQFMDEDFGRESDAARNRLINQGLQPGTEAYDREMALLSRGQNEARTQAAFRAQQVGHQQAGDLLTRALDTRRLQGLEAGQDASTRLASRGMLGQEQGQDAATRLASRGALMGERSQDADRLNNQSSQLAQLLLAARGQDYGRANAQDAAMGAASSANASAAVARENMAMQSELERRRLGLSQDSMDFSQLMQLLQASRGGVNVPNFGSPSPLDVGGAYGIASNNNNAQQNRDATDRASYANLGAAAINGIARNW